MRKQELLIVDDQLGIRLLLNEVFKKEGYSSYEAANGMEALQLLEQRDTIALILLDMKMPDMDGMTILRKVKKMKPDIPVLMMTAYCELDLINQAMELGVVRYFTKPFDIFDVRDEVNNILNA